jgi:hypothetical protein
MQLQQPSKGGRSGNASYRDIPDPFFDAGSKNDARFGPRTSISKARPLLCAKKEVFCHLLLFLLFWTISPTRIGLLIWLGAYFEAKTLGHTSHPLAGR